MQIDVTFTFSFHYLGALLQELSFDCCLCRDVLRERGSAVDAAIAVTFCLGIHDIHSAGIGGGFHMVVYDT